jgi:adenylylsulfate kinase
VVIAAAISPYRDVREEVRRAHESPFVEAFVDCSLDELMRRDSKGLYAKAMRGELPNFTGVSDPYEPPALPQIHLHSDRETVDESAAKILAWLEREGLLGPPGSA